ncbi:hypothetical protein CDAR_209981 [Caerostris darwini]|uniref:Uncharacterized protein n=1 Tax=Caerostris darwini TaxID=1538125 RepID=A0AAV4QHL5_9ARAC|nr:hypothetical protein CDAR_209981 [Caerostris darwini]
MSLELRRGYFNNRPARLRFAAHKVILKNSLPVCGCMQGRGVFFSFHFTLPVLAASALCFFFLFLLLSPNPFTLSYGKCKPLTVTLTADE